MSLMRFFTVPDGVQARRSAAWAMGIISYFQFVVVFIGLGAIVLLTGNPEFTSGGLALRGGSNMAAVHLSQIIGGNIFMGFYLRGRVRHHSCRGFRPDVVRRRDRFPRPVCRRHPQGGLHRRGRTARVQADRGPVERRRHVAGNPCSGARNVAVLATLPLVIAASANFPVLFLFMYWKGFTTRGALIGGYTGLLLAVSLIIPGGRPSG